MKKAIRLQFISSILGLIFLALSQLGCQGNNSSGNNPNVASHGVKHFRTDLSQGSPFYQYSGNISGGIAFSPQYKPLTSSFKNPANTRENSGALIYSELNGTLFVLIGLEKQNSSWNIMRGAVEKGDDFVKTAAKELHEESAGVYQVTENVLLNESFDVYINHTANNAACTFFVKMPHLPASDILTAAKTHSKAAFKEMKDYRWISLNSLRNGIATGNETFQATIDNGQTETINMYRYTFLILTQAEQKGILQNLY